jgi:hypothetical protein
MITLSYTVLTIWIFGLIFFAIQILNYIRLIYNNLAPSDRFGNPREHFDWESYFFKWHRITPNPKYLTDTGRLHQRGIYRTYWMILAWFVIGSAIIAYLFSYVVPSSSSG